jgi:hypothetical protein
MKIVTSLSFPGNCREAFEFYARVPGVRPVAARTARNALGLARHRRRERPPKGLRHTLLGQQEDSIALMEIV